ncbi:hypothetical protein [Saccharopolyspora shandongensis]|uniref:hypothetical protein n=1 Tax=Saccharopolyspora shandongensis TaxID=418495 RepID=UPI00340E6A2D
MNWLLWFFAGYVPGLAVLVIALCRLHGREPTGQHSGSGDGALTVERLIARVENDQVSTDCYGRHALRDPGLFRVAV